MLSALHKFTFIRNCCAIAVLMLHFVGSAQAEITSVEEAINKAGRQRMLSQRIAKTYIQIGLTVEERNSRSVLKESILNINQSLRELKAFAPTPQIKQSYVQVEQKWLALKSLLRPESVINVGDAQAVINASAELLKQAELATKQLQEYSGKNLGRLVNIAGRQRMLSQRISMLAQAREWSIPIAEPELEGRRQEFITAMGILETASETTPEIRNELLLVSNQWIFLNQAITEKATSKEARMKNIATTSERILEVLDGVTLMYSKKRTN